MTMQQFSDCLQSNVKASAPCQLGFKSLFTEISLQISDLNLYEYENAIFQKRKLHPLKRDRK